LTVGLASSPSIHPQQRKKSGKICKRHHHFSLFSVALSDSKLEDGVQSCCLQNCPRSYKLFDVHLQVTDKDAAQPFMLEAETNSFMFQGWLTEGSLPNVSQLQVPLSNSG